MGIIGKLLGGLVLLGALGGGGAFILAKQAPSVATGLKPVVGSTAAAQSFDAKLEALNAAVAVAKKTGKAQPVTVTFTEAELTSKASIAGGALNDTGLAATETQVHLAGGNIVATASVTFQGISLNLGVVAAPAVVNDQPRIVIKEIQTGALPIPDLIKEQLSARLGRAVDPSMLGLPIEVNGLTVGDGTLVVSGVARP